MTADLCHSLNKLTRGQSLCEGPSVGFAPRKENEGVSK